MTTEKAIFLKLLTILIPGSQILVQSDLHAYAILDRKLSLPCKSAASLQHRREGVILWFKDDIESPIYRLDLRVPEVDRRGLPDGSGGLHGRCAFRFSPVPRLEISRAQLVDSGTYRCRVDTRSVPTKIVTIHAHVIVLPHRPVILDSVGEAVGNVTRPFREGDNVSLTCHCKGGDPPPRLTWMEDGMVVGSEPSQRRGDVTESSLWIHNLTRNHFGRPYACAAQNNDVSEPIVTAVLLDMLLKPTFVRLRCPETLVSGASFNASCLSEGSHPGAEMIWRLGSTELLRIPDPHEGKMPGGSIRNVISLTPTEEDDGKFLTCVARNPAMPEVPLETSALLNVEYTPLVRVVARDFKDALDLEENQTLVLTCLVRSNPPSYKVVWKKNNNVLRQNFDEGHKSRNVTLVMGRLTREDSGAYSCVASNVQGDGESIKLVLRVKHKPFCVKRVESFHWSPREGSGRVSCSVKSYPEVLSYHWSQLSDQGSSVNSTTAGNTLTLSWRDLVHISRRDGGDQFRIDCRAENEMGVQERPCTTVVKVTDFIHPSKNCRIVNQTHSAVQIRCRNVTVLQDTFFDVRVYEEGKPRVVYNFTSHRPLFWCEKLKKDVSYLIQVFIRTRPTSRYQELETKTWKVEEWIQGTGGPGTTPWRGPGLLGLGALALLLLALLSAGLACHLGRRKVGEENRRPPTPVDL